VFFVLRRSTRILVNTVASYARLAAAAVASFIALPIALRVLGPADFGAFSVIAGSLSALLFINSALTGGAQRHIAYALGEGGGEEVGQWFRASLVIHTALALGVLLIALGCAHWAIYKLLSLPSTRLAAAMWTYRATVIVICWSIISTPYQALIVAKESIAALSLMAMVSSLFLAVAIHFLNVLPGDRLVWFSGIYAASDGILFLGPVLFCLTRYSECRQFFTNATDWKKIQRLLGFSSWNLLGTLAVQIRYQGPGVLLNRFVGTTANAANGIALQINGFASSVSTGLLIASSPPVVKAEGSGDRSEMLFLSNLSNKYAFVIVWLLVGPLLFELKHFLGWWLHQVPTYTVAFSTALLIALLIDMLTAGFTTAVQAEGRIARYQLVIGLLLLISVPAGYLLLRAKMPPSSVWWAAVSGSALAGLGRLWFLCTGIGLKGREWLHRVLCPCLVTCAVCCIGMEAIVICTNLGWPRLLWLYALNTAMTTVLGWVFASSDRERRLRQSYVAKLQQQAFSGSRWVLALATRRT
jgi:Na+-driven multidrug efflux pump